MRTKLHRYFVFGALPLLAALGAGSLYQDFVVNAVNANFALNMMIIATMFVGAGLMYLRMWQMWREDQALAVFLTLRKRSKGIDPEEVSQTMRKLLDTPRFARLDVRRVLEPVARTGGRIRSRVDQAAIEGEMESILKTMESRWEFPNFLVGFLVALGLLGTFIGLLETLVGTSALIGNFGGSGSMDEAIKKLVTGLQHPLAGMGTAFSASMFGLVGSSVLGMVMMAVRACGTTLMNNILATINAFAERVVTQGVTTASNVSEGYLANALADLMDVQKDAQQTFNETLQASLAVNAKSEGVMIKLNEVADAVNAQTESIKRSNDLMAVGPRMRELAEQSLGETKALVGAMQAQYEAIERLQSGMNALERRLGTQSDLAARERELLRGAISAIGESQNATKALLVSVIEQDVDSRSGHIREMQSLRQSMIETNASMSSWGERLLQLQSLSAEQVLLTERQGHGIVGMADAVNGLSRQLTVTVEESSRQNEAARAAQIEVAKQLSGLGTVLRLNNESLTEHITKLAESNTRHSTMASMVAQEVRQLRGNMGREVRKELREAVGQIVSARSMTTADDD